MKPEIKEKWDEALRSGIYPQGKFRLYDGTNYCCLGVLCKLYLNETCQTWDEGYYEDGRSRDEYYIASESEVLPAVVREWAGLTNADPLVGIDVETLSLANLNDEKGYTFSQIADVIKAQL